SPLSLLAFAIDAIIRPPVEKSLYLRLMLLGRRSDRMINLFDDHADGGELTIDRAVDEVEEMVRSARSDTSESSTTAAKHSQEKP
ncbi:MAG: hypothetical protein NWQ45_06555, partial [Congregibacter sp.]|nr:hypothetical protein [Congregibacter sp.]